MSDPDNNIEYLYLLLDHCEKRYRNTKNMKNSQDIGFPVELSIISLVLVIKDLVPGYKISSQVISLDDNTNDKVILSQKTRKVHLLERKIMDLYKKTCLFLRKFLCLNKTINLNKNNTAVLKSAMDLLDSTYHFNHHIILLRMFILFLMSFNDDYNENNFCLSYSSEGIKNILINDTTLEIGVESVNIIHEALFGNNNKNNKKYHLNKWILYPFTKYSPWNRIEESKNEYRRIFGLNKNNITDEIIDELQQTSSTRVKVEILVQREEQILKHLFSFYAKVILLDNYDLEHVYSGISHYSNRISSKIRLELTALMKDKLSKGSSLKWREFIMVLKCCFSLIQKGSNLSEQQLEDNSWILRYLILRLEKEQVQIKQLNQSSGKTGIYNLNIVNELQNKEFTNTVLNISIFSGSNSNYLYRLIFSIMQISLYLSKIHQAESSLILFKLCGQLLIKYPRIRIMLDPEGIPCNDFPIDTSSVLSSWSYQEISLYHIIQEILGIPEIDIKIRLACNLLLSESDDKVVRENAISSIKLIDKNNKMQLFKYSKNFDEIKPFYYILKLIDI